VGKKKCGGPCVGGGGTHVGGAKKVISMKGLFVFCCCRQIRLKAQTSRTQKFMVADP